MKKILVIEDMSSIREQIISILKSNGFEARGAENGSYWPQNGGRILS